MDFRICTTVGDAVTPLCRMFHVKISLNLDSLQDAKDLLLPKQILDLEGYSAKTKSLQQIHIVFPIERPNISALQNRFSIVDCTS